MAEVVSFSPPTPLPFNHYDAMRASLADLEGIAARPLVAMVDVDDSQGQLMHVGRNMHFVEETSEVLCHVPIFFQWSEGNVNDVSSEAYGGSAAALLAMHHFNTGNSSIVDELKGLPETCPLKFTADLVDSESSGQVAMQSLTRYLTRNPGDPVVPQPCVVLGSSRSSTTKQLATVSGVYDLPHITPSASSVDLDNESEYPLFSRTHPSDASMALLSIDYLSTQLNVDFVGVLYVDNGFGSSYNLELQKYAAQYNITLASESFRPGAEDSEVFNALQRLQDTGYRYFLGVFFAGDYERVMTKALELGIAGEDTFWMFNGALASQFINGKLELVEGSAAAKATFGTAILTDEGGLPGLDTHHDRFLEAWRSLGSDQAFLEYMNEKIPQSSNLNFARSGDFFEDLAPSHIAAFSYDAVIGLGLSACALLEGWDSQEGIFTGTQHHSKFLQTNFQGASGNVQIGPETHSRKSESTYHVVSNILDRHDIPTKDMTLAFQGKPWTVFDTKTGSWTRYDTENDFIYSNGSFQRPAQIPTLEADNHELSDGIRAIAYTMSALAMALSVGFFGYCCVRHREHRVIRAAQPFFLSLICLGSTLLASAIIPTAMDDYNSTSPSCSNSCVARVWLAPLGFCLIFSALFSKLWRVNKLLSMATTFRRIEVTARDVMIPLVCLMGANMLVLTVWTIHDKPYWEREILEYDAYGRPSETWGYCHSDHYQAYLYTLVGINGLALVLAIWQAWIGRGITTDFSESKYIGMATVCIFQALLMGIPITMIAKEDPNALLFVVTTIISVICFSILLLIFVPKILAIHANQAPDFATSTIHIHGTKVSMGGQTQFTPSNSNAMGGFGREDDDDDDDYRGGTQSASSPISMVGAVHNSRVSAGISSSSGQVSISLASIQEEEDAEDSMP